ncbi:NAD-dependent epimerase/dehydratase family protein [Vagococcus hydrophili]|uniref:NAD-dependent epimerase/dehydratase family protein n=1 Tax=Vagococcus hydrophili TaxID=2714947 RepID=A0A6G8AR55_9ENTE|nr:NAD-dependent epimerase/dehydratase family protein [Vagococcus hydrophili]QIL47422.1 NAD-dependent epimerase/dehydratase family protein [Vagococcus hydrophili]
MKKILVTGGAGFIGSNLVKKICISNEVVIIDDLSMGRKKNINNLPNVTFYEKSVLDRHFMEDILIQENFDCIYHLAAIASVADSIERPSETHEVNFDSTLFILETLRKMENRNLKRLIFSSSAAVYGDDKELPKKENSPIKPLSPYAIDKFSSEKYTLMYNDLYGVPTSSVRFFNVYGPNQNPSSPYSGVMSILVDRYVKKIKNESSEFNLFGDGEQSRDFIYVDDVVKALEIIAYSNDSKGKVYNVGTGNETTINDLISIISRYLNEEIKINKLEERSGDIKKSVADISNLRELGFEVDYTIDNGLKSYLKFLDLIK